MPADGAVLRGAFEVVVAVVWIAADCLVVVQQRGGMVPAGALNLSTVVQQHGTVQELLVRPEVGVGDLHRLVHERQGAVDVRPVQLDEGPCVAHECHDQHAPVRIRVEVGDRDRGVGPGQRQILVVDVLAQEAGVEHRHQVARAHMDVGAGGATPHLLEVADGFLGPPQVGKTRADLVGAVPVRLRPLGTRDEPAPAQCELHYRLVEAHREALVDGRDESLHSGAGRVGPVLQAVGDGPEPQGRFAEGGQFPCAGGVRAGPLLRRQVGVGAKEGRVPADAVGIDEQLCVVGAGRQLRLGAGPRRDA
ncbi:hypothetical protein QMK19_21040 [Streptomyces sp. H10-C2]|uniref:hypothetical protein n=1 Tax=unclassified Streptomyces TaxID=2593676 RepID=UPI0024B98464|nr:MULTISPECIES: hypothetical protein [unclassified Streptomyces]MDJ0344434.1 hypothetical protein [Streptomyces sp. PH10-H1]MDJ0372090.1 hypothetical protein [Streptomyces sp. H10-C2]